MRNWAARLALGLLVLLGLPGAAAAFAWAAHQMLVARHLAAVGAGFALGLAGEHLLLSRIPGFRTFVHEATHAWAALLLGGRVTRFVATRDSGGVVEHSGVMGGELGSDFVGLAPYLLPAFAVPLVLARSLVEAHWRVWLDPMIGAAYAIHVINFVDSALRSWSSRPFRSAGDGELLLSDIARRGRIYSLSFILTLGLLLNGVLLCVLASGYARVGQWWHLVSQTTFDFVVRVGRLGWVLVEELGRLAM